MDNENQHEFDNLAHEEIDISFIECNYMPYDIYYMPKVTI